MLQVVHQVVSPGGRSARGGRRPADGQERNVPVAMVCLALLRMRATVPDCHGIATVEPHAPWPEVRGNGPIVTALRPESGSTLQVTVRVFDPIWRVTQTQCWDPAKK